MLNKLLKINEIQSNNVKNNVKKENIPPNLTQFIQNSHVIPENDILSHLINNITSKGAMSSIALTGSTEVAEFVYVGGMVAHYAIQGRNLYGY